MSLGLIKILVLIEDIDFISVLEGFTPLTPYFTEIWTLECSKS
jgi:hypothetical protein